MEEISRGVGSWEDYREAMQEMKLFEGKKARMGKGAKAEAFEGEPITSFHVQKDRDALSNNIRKLEVNGRVTMDAVEISK